MKKEIIGHHFDRDDVFIAIVNHCLEVQETKVIKSHTTVKNIYIDTDTLSKVYNGDKLPKMGAVVLIWIEANVWNRTLPALSHCWWSFTVCTECCMHYSRLDKHVNLLCMFPLKRRII